MTALWKAEDGDAAAFEEFVRTSFAGDTGTLDALFTRLERAFESLDGHMLEIVRDFRMHTDLDSGAILPFDEILAGYDPSAHATDDMFGNKLAFVVLLNFPLTTLEQRLAEGDRWTRRQWAEARLADRFSKRIPGEVNLEIARASAEADQYIAQYNVWMHHLLDEKGQRLFPAQAAPALPLEPARRDQGELLRGSGDRAAEAADDPEGHGADRHADDPRGRRGQPALWTGTRTPTP